MIDTFVITTAASKYIIQTVVCSYGVYAIKKEFIIISLPKCDVITTIFSVRIKQLLGAIILAYNYENDKSIFICFVCLIIQTKVNVIHRLYVLDIQLLNFYSFVNIIRKFIHGMPIDDSPLVKNKEVLRKSL